MMPFAVTDWQVMLPSAGVAGIVLAWFMLRLESILTKNTNALDRVARANLLLVISLKQASDGAKEEAHKITREIDDTKPRNGK